MRLHPVAYMEWAKRHQIEDPPRYDLSSSGLQSVTAEEWQPGMPPITSRHTYGDTAIHERLAARFNVACEHVLSTLGSSMANFLVAAALLDTDTAVAIEYPVYEPLLALPRAFGCRIRHVIRRPTEGWRFDIAEAAQAMREGAQLVILSDLYNPASTAMSVEDLQQLGHAAAQNDAWALVDEVYLDATEGPIRPIAAALHPRLISTASLTKVYGLGMLRGGWIVAAGDIMRRVRQAVDHTYVATTAPSDWLVAQALDHLAWLESRSRQRRAINRPLVEAFLARHPHLQWTPPAGGFTYFVRTPDGMAERLESQMRAHHVQVSPGRFFGDPTGFRLGLGVATETLQGGLEALEGLVRQGGE